MKQMSELFESKWSETKSALTEGLAGNKKKTMDIILENTKRYLSESATAGATSAGNVATLNRVILPVIRRVMPTVIANEIVGVQPMTGPVGQIHTLRIRYADSSSGTTTTTAGEEALSPFKIAEAYSGDNSSTKAAATAALEGSAGKRLSIQILKQAVEAKSRKLSARWTFEAAQDAQAQQGIDVEAEIMAALAQEITAEIDQEVIGSLQSLATSNGNNETYDQSGVSGTATFVGDEHAALAILINRVANVIAQRTRRGAGNYAVVSPQALTILQSATTSAFARSTEGTFEAPSNTKFVGTLNAAMRVYVNAYAADDSNVLVGYKGASEADAPAFYCPYIPLMSSGVVLDPATFEPVVGFLTRYGYVELNNTASSLGNAADYLGTVGISNVSFK
jgi:hypothetical protein|tara:strand:- start:251 stop:1432 length:1182 start_codon:yes stop_codon:yes gene_type:complete